MRFGAFLCARCSRVSSRRLAPTCQMLELVLVWACWFWPFAPRGRSGSDPDDVRGASARAGLRNLKDIGIQAGRFPPQTCGLTGSVPPNTPRRSSKHHGTIPGELVASRRLSMISSAWTAACLRTGESGFCRVTSTQDPHPKTRARTKAR